MLERIWGYPLDKLKKYYNIASVLQVILYVVDIAFIFLSVYLMYESNVGGAGYIRLLLGVVLVVWILICLLCGSKYKAYKAYKKVKEEDIKTLRVQWGTPLRNSLKNEFGTVLSTDFAEAVNFIASTSSKREMNRLYDILVEFASVDGSYSVYYTNIKKNVLILDAQVKEVSDNGENSSDDEGTD